MEPLLYGQAKTLTALLALRAAQHPTLPAFTFLENGNEQTLTFSSLHDSACKVACGLLERVNTGDRVVLLCPPGLDYITLFFGCLYAGVVAVPLYPPRMKQRTDRIGSVLLSSGAALIATTDAMKAPLERYFESHTQLAMAPLASIGEITAAADKRELPVIDEQALAFIQYTSGSTGTPKGVMISQRNIMANLNALRDVTGCAPKDIFVNWLPLFHDLGLINTVMLPVFLGAHSVLMSAVNFIQRPVSWFEAISRFKGTICGAPNFAYALCVEKIHPGQLNGIDLSSWTLAFNAAEPINAATLESFASAFAAAGFQMRALYPAYGMAEATVFLTGGTAQVEPIIHAFDKEKLKHYQAEKSVVNSQRLVSCGRISPHHGLHIVDPVTKSPLPDGSIGEIWVCGPSISAGYWGLPELSDEVFGARMAGNDQAYLRTGDLGFVDDNQLYVSGRLKDVVIVRGQNYFPQDIELAAFHGHASLVPNAAAAFTVDDNDNERLVLVQEVKASLLNTLNLSEVAAAIRRAIALECELKADVVLVRQGSLSKTSSGKVQRSLTKSRYLSGELSPLDYSEEEFYIAENPGAYIVSNPLQQRLLDIWQEILKSPAASAEHDFFALGGDSLDATRVQAKIEREFGLELPADFIFSHTTIDEQAAYINQCAASENAAHTRTISPGNQDSGPLSFAQQRLWFLNQMEEQRKMLNLPVVLSIKGVLDATRLTHAFNRVIARHEILRTTYQWQDNGVCQQINAAQPVAIAVDDFTSDIDQPARLTQSIADEAAAEFNLDLGPVFRLRLLRLADEHHYLLFTVHHIAADAWSMDILINELIHCYTDTAVTLPAPGIRYIDFARWQHHNYEAGAASRLQDYWQQQLADAPALLALPYDYPRPKRQVFAGARYAAPIADELADRLQAISQQHKTTLFVTLLSAFQLQLSRLSNSRDIVIGTDIAHRNHSQLTQVLGFFVNQLVLRNSICESDSFTDLVQSNKTMLTHAIAHQDMPFDKLVDALALARNSSYSPVFQVKFLLNYSPVDALVLPDLDIVQLEQRIEYAQYDLTLSIDFDNSNGFKANFHYNKALFDESTIAGFMADYMAILAAVASQADITLARVPCVLTQQDSFQQWMHGKAQQNPESIKQLFEQQASQAPERIAVVYRDQSMTFATLNAEANRLANFLADLDLEPGSFVGVHIERSINQVVTLLALVKLGVGFLPLDPDYPAGRIEYMLNDSRVDYVITSDAEHEHLMNYDGGVIGLDADRLLIADESHQNRPDTDIDPGRRAYLLYTSGSSGQPKGAQISAGALLNLCHWYAGFAGINADSCVLQPIPLSFDASIKNIFTPLMCGAKLVLPSNVPFDPAVYCQLISQHQVTLINCVPSFFYPIIELAAKDNFAPLQSLEMLALGGEATDLSRCRPWLQSDACHCVLANIYGPTECADISAAYKLDPAQLDDIEVMPIGRPINNASIYIVNSDLSLVPPGVSGELLIGGAGVALGYTGQARAGVESDRFIADTFTGHGKLYRTGDLARWDKHGQLVYQGRIDSQVKINGIRIEIGEIESALLAFQGIRQALVLQVNNRLIAYLVTTGLTPPTADQLRARLAQQLPPAWMPKAFILLESMPLLPNGKIDQAALKAIPIPENQERDIELPQTDIEHILVDIWCQVLAMTRIGTNENFFQLGGDSMAAVKVVALAQGQGLALSVADIFALQTIRSLAQGRTLAVLSDAEKPHEKNHKNEPAFDMLSDDDMSVLLELNQ